MMMLNFDFVLRLLVAGILGAIIGLDREYRAKEAQQQKKAQRRERDPR